MITQKEYTEASKTTEEYFKKVGIKITDDEKKRIEVADFGLGDLKNVGLQILTYVNTERVCAKELVLTPFQTCPQHRHIGSETAQGKEETFRCRYGKVFLYVSGDGRKEDIAARMPNTEVDVFHEIVLCEGEQYTLMPNTWHWFQADKDGAVVSEFSTHSTDETDIFFDKRIVRAPKVESK